MQNILLWKLISTMFFKNLTCGGKDHPHGIVLRRRPSHTGQENPRTPAPTHTQWPVALWVRPDSDYALDMGTDEGIFLPLHYQPEIRPRRGSNPGRQAGGATEPASQSSLAVVRKYYVFYIIKIIHTIICTSNLLCQAAEAIINECNIWFIPSMEEWKKQ